MAKAAAKKTTKRTSPRVESGVMVSSSKAPIAISDTQPSVINKRLIVLSLIVLGGGMLVFLFYRWLVVAWVDRTPITRVGMYQQLEARYGKELTEQMITEALITNEAKIRKVSVTKEAVQAEIKKLEDQQGGVDKLNQVLSFQGMTRAELEKQINYQLLIREMFGKGIVVSDEEVDQYIESNKEQFGVVDDKTRQSIKDQLNMQKVGQAFNTWLTENKSGKRVVRYN